MTEARERVARILAAKEGYPDGPVNASYYAQADQILAAVYESATEELGDVDDMMRRERVEALGRFVGSAVGMILQRRMLRRQDAPPWIAYLGPVAISLLAYPYEARMEDWATLADWSSEAGEKLGDRLARGES